MAPTYSNGQEMVSVFFAIKTKLNTDFKDGLSHTYLCLCIYMYIIFCQPCMRTYLDFVLVVFHKLSLLCDAETNGII